MGRFTVTQYFTTFVTSYDIEANSKEEAIEIVQERVNLDNVLEKEDLLMNMVGNEDVDIIDFGSMT